MKMPKVTECQAQQCAYNIDGQCHALAITVGDGIHLQCDTFCPADHKGGDMKATAGVGACKVEMCKHNKKLECHAHNVAVGYLGDQTRCLTYKHT